jgi:peptidase E
MAQPTIVAMGGGFSMEPDNPLLDDWLLSLTGRPCPRVCFVPTASGDSDTDIVRFYRAFGAGRAEPSHLSLFDRSGRDLRSFVLSQDLLYVGGGNTVNLLAVWRAHQLDAVLREAHEEGVILAGLSAGSLCWYEGGITDSFGPDLEPLPDGLGLLEGSHGPHYDGEPQRRPCYQRAVGEGTLPAGMAADDGVALLYRNGKLADAVTSRPGAGAYHVQLDTGGVSERPIRPRELSDG